MSHLGPFLHQIQQHYELSAEFRAIFIDKLGLFTICSSVRNTEPQIP